MNNGVGCVACLVSVALVAEAFGESKPHAEFLSVAPTVAVSNIAVSNVAATMVYVSTLQESFIPMEQQIPHDRLVIQTNGFLSSATKP
jgi:hypothetical protein